MERQQRVREAIKAQMWEETLLSKNRQISELHLKILGLQAGNKRLCDREMELESALGQIQKDKEYSMSLERMVSESLREEIAKLNADHREELDDQLQSHNNDWQSWK